MRTFVLSYLFFGDGMTASGNVTLSNAERLDVSLLDTAREFAAAQLNLPKKKARNICIVSAFELEPTLWTLTADTPPDDERTVLGSFPGQDDPVWLCYKDGDEWHDISGAIAVAPTHWMDLPEAPPAASRKAKGSRPKTRNPKSP